MSIDVNVQNDLVIVTESSEDIVVNVSNAAGPAGPAGVGVPVGGSTGQVLKKLSATNYDTYWALDGGGVPYTGATGDVDLGEYELKAGQVEFDQTPTGAIGAAVMRWNDSDGTVDLGLKGGNVTLQVGQEQVLRVVNKTGADLLESQYRAVRIRLVSEGGSQGQRLAVVLAQGDNDPDSTTTIGIVTENIDNNQEGFITTSGEVRGINTTGSLQSETWVDGDIIYLSPTIPGGITKVKPTAPQHLLQLGYVIYAHNVNGKIFVKIDNGYELGELHDVFAPSPTDGQGIFWNTANLRYQNNTVAGILGYTPVPTTRTLTINGTAYDLSADRSWTVSGTNIYTADGTLTGNRVVTSNGNSLTILGGKEFFTDVQTALILEGTATTKYIELRLKNNNANGRTYGIRSDIDGKLVYVNYNTITNIYSYDPTNTQHTFVGSQTNLSGSSITNLGLWLGTLSGTSSNFSLYNSSSVLSINGTNEIRLLISNVEKARLTTAGRFLLGTTSEGTYLLDVNGNARFSASALIGVSGNSIPSVTAIAKIANNAGGCDLEINGNGYARLFFADYSRGTDLKYYEMLNFNGDWKISRLNDANNTRTERLTIFGATGNVFVGLSPSDAGYKLDVNGTARVSQLAFSGQTISNTIATSLSIISTSAVNLESQGGQRFLMGYTGGSLTGSFLLSQNFYIGSNIPTFKTAILELESTTHGFLPPRMSSTAKNAIASPAAGLQVYDTTLGSVSVYDGTSWRNDTDTVTANRQTASYTLALTDRGKLVEMNVAGANNLTVPLNSVIAFPIGSKVDLSQYGAGQTTVVATGGVTVRSAGGALKLAAQYSGASLIKIGTDEWYLFGDITV